MPVDIRRAYFDIQQLRKEVRKAEREFMRCFARPPKRPLRTAGMTARGPKTANPQMPVLKQALN